VEEEIPKNHHEISYFAEFSKEGTELRKEI